MKKGNLVKIIIALVLLLLLNVVYTSSLEDNTTLIINKYKKISPEKLLEKGDSFFDKNRNDSAMICFSLIYNDLNIDNSEVSNKIICKALNKASILYYYHCDYKASLELLLKALKICEEIQYKEYIGRIYNNIGNVHYQFKDFNSAKKNYKLAYENLCDKYLTAAVLNNLGMLAHDDNKLDSALMLYKKASAIIKFDMNDSIYDETLNNIGTVYQEMQNYDSAFFYHRAALNSAGRFIDSERNSATILHNIGKLHFLLKNYDSAFFYLEKGNKVAEKFRLYNILAGNYLFFSEIEEARGNTDKSFKYYKKYSQTKDSIFNASKYGSINELQFMYDMAKIDKHIKLLNSEQQIKEKTIMMQKIFQIFLILILLIVISFLVLLYLKNKRLNAAHTKLVEKSLDIVHYDELNKHLHDTKYQSSNLKNDTKNELMMSILDVMNKRDLFCDVNFSLDVLAEMVNSNTTYVSQIINEKFNKNFRSFLNEYRIREACKILSDSENKKYSIETIASMVGFKSKGSFNPIFKEVTGVTPSFYINSITK